LLGNKNLIHVDGSDDGVEDGAADGLLHWKMLGGRLYRTAFVDERTNEIARVDRIDFSTGLASQNSQERIEQLGEESAMKTDLIEKAKGRPLRKMLELCLQTKARSQRHGGN
jgi:hypothetical protein